MKGLIFSITAGQGHNQTAKVMSEHFNSLGIECSYMDVFKYINPMISDTVDRIYLMSAKKMPKVYGGIYRMCEKRPYEEIDYTMPRLTTTLLARKLLKYIRKEKPDFIICTHVFAALLVSFLNDHIKGDILKIGIVTDFTIHPYWEDTCLDYYVTPSEVLTGQGIKKGIPEEKFLPFGIPIDKKFSSKISREEALKELGLPDFPTVLVMSGSMGFGKIIEEIESLDELERDFQIVSICGNNARLKKRIDGLKTKKQVYNYGYVNNVDVFMDAADCIITKPGGLTTSEALSKGLPMIMSNPVPGQEDRNVEFLLNAGAAIKVSRTYSIADAVNTMFGGNRKETMIQAIENLRKPDAAQKLAEFVIEKIGK